LLKVEGILKYIDPKVGCTQRKRNMEKKEAHWEEEHNFCKVFYNIEEKVDKLFLEYEKALGHEKKYVDESGSENHEGVKKEPPPSPSSSDTSHHSNHDYKHTSKKPFL